MRKKLICSEKFWGSLFVAAMVITWLMGPGEPQPRILPQPANSDSLTDLRGGESRYYSGDTVLIHVPDTITWHKSQVQWDTTPAPKGCVWVPCSDGTMHLHRILGHPNNPTGEECLEVKTLRR